MKKVSYALGLSLGNNLLGSGVTSLDYAQLAKGIQDVMEQKEPEISYQEAQTIIGEFFQNLQAKMAEKAQGEGKVFLEEVQGRRRTPGLVAGLQDPG